MKQQIHKQSILYTIPLLTAIIASMLIVPAFATHVPTSWATPPWTTRQSLPQYGCSFDGKTCAFAESSGTVDVYAKATGSYESKTATGRLNHSISPTSVGLTPQMTLSSTETRSFEMYLPNGGSGIHTQPSGSTAAFSFGSTIWKQSGSSWVIQDSCNTTLSGNGAKSIPSSSAIICTKSIPAGTYRTGVNFQALAQEDVWGGTTITDWKTGAYGLYVSEINICHNPGPTGCF